MNGAILSLIVEPDRVEPVCDLAAGLWGRTVTEHRDDARRDVRLDIYFDDAAQAEGAARTLPAGGIRSFSILEFAPEDWTESWKRHFRALDIGERLRVVPPWLASPDPDPSGRAELVIDPGLSFGTGNHFTTGFCLRQLDRLAPRLSGATVLDVGTGSGILAIAAAKLGARQAAGWDFDPVCVRQAAENARINGVADRTTFALRDIASDPSGDRRDVVCANLYSALLRDHAPGLMGLAGRALILSGLKKAELDAVSETYLRLGAREEERESDDEWGGLVLAPPEPKAPAG